MEIFAISLTCLFVVIATYLFFRMSDMYSKQMETINRNDKDLDVLLKFSNIRIWIYDTKTDLFHRFDEVGHKYDDISVADMEQFFETDEVLHFRDMIKTLVSNEKEYIDFNFNTRYKRYSPNNQDEFVYKARVGVLTREGKKVKTLLFTIQDITSLQKRKDEEKRILNETRQVFDNTHVPMSFIDGQGYYKEVNDSWVNFMGISKDFVRERQLTFFDVWGQPMENFIKENHNEGVAILNSKEVTDRIGIPDVMKRDVHVKYSMTAYRNDKGELQFVNVSFVDISDTRETMENAEKLYKDIRKLNDDISSCIKMINDILGKSNMVVFAMEPFTHALYTTSKDGKLDKKMTREEWMPLFSDQSLSNILALLDSHDKSSSDDKFTFMADSQKDESGYSRKYRITGVPSEFDGRRIYFGIMQDISEQRDLAEKMKSDNTHSHEFEDLKQAFIHNMDCEIKKPLSSIVGLSEKIHNDTDRETLREYAKQVNDNARDMLNKIYDVIEKSKSELNNEKKEKL